MIGEDAATEARTAITAVLTEFTTGGSPGVVVDSPPGAGKSTLVVEAATRLAENHEPVMVVAQTNEQVDDLVDRMARAAPAVLIGRLSAQDYVPTPRVNHSNVTVATNVTDLGQPQITVGTAAKWVHITDHRWPWAILDEAYQMRSDMLLRIAPRFDRALFVGDPGQLDPFSTVDIDRWTGLRWDPMQSAVAAVLRNNPGLPVHQLPLSWRLDTSAAAPVSKAFYPFTGFRAATAAGVRQLSYQTRGFGRPDDETLDTAARTGWALYELPARHTLRTDTEAVHAVVDLAERVLQRGAVARSELDPAGSPVTLDRIAIGAAHRDQAAAIRLALRDRGIPAITVDTANRLQGSEYDLTLVLHPLSGRRDATAFHLESGRLCVLTSRHRHACIVVARAGIQELLDAHPSSEPMHIDVPAKFPDGWEANQAMLAHLRAHRVAAP
ncbi:MULTISPECIES: AAA domain-containing protein [unclassified Crossiella]|uniref:AAA domain-containing protein n=1 Tax=unclassified Crossiella TaxID=2620835 RepID=UPI001FFF37B0|nr:MULTISPECIES: AAA domain-containing protein [unclassified Crossiella]MCK2239732.1 AAA family ATPase [Crossiella sp. S99.2]MCK2252427.1 AAA family ATPase [Crossiella sp. S99.1]